MGEKVSCVVDLHIYIGYGNHPQIFRQKWDVITTPNFARTPTQDLPTFMDGGSAGEVLLIKSEGR